MGNAFIGELHAANDNYELVDELAHKGVIFSDNIEQTMMDVDRGEFCDF